MENKVMPKVFGWMFIGLLITFLTGIVVFKSPNMMFTVFTTGWFWGIIVVEFLLVIFLSARITKMKPLTAKIAFILYSFVSGLTFSSIFATYELTSIMWVFFVAAAIFGLFAVIGSVTKQDLTKMGSLLLMALIGVLICVVINIFFNNDTFDLIISIITILVFIGFTAYDIQKIKRLGEANFIEEDNLAIYGALELYLDFINIFLELLNLMGKSDN